jgi:hypothetical protein
MDAFAPPLAVAVIFVLPSETAVIKPVSLIVATPVLEDLKVKDLSAK